MNLATLVIIIPKDNIRVLKRKKIKENIKRDEIINISIKIALYFFAQKILSSWIKEREFKIILNPKISNVDKLIRLWICRQKYLKKHNPNIRRNYKEEKTIIFEFLKVLLNSYFLLFQLFYLN